MSGPLIYVGTYTIKPGNQEEARRRLAELVDFVETNEPRCTSGSRSGSPARRLTRRRTSTRCSATTLTRPWTTVAQAVSAVPSTPPVANRSERSPSDR